jgi:hypothetical protein
MPDEHPLIAHSYPFGMMGVRSPSHSRQMELVPSILSRGMVKRESVSNAADSVILRVSERYQKWAYDWFGQMRQSVGQLRQNSCGRYRAARDAREWPEGFLMIETRGPEPGSRPR